MFERITFRKQDKQNSERPIDLGLILEAMLFYKKVTVVADAVILKQLVNTFGIIHLENLLERRILEIQYTETICGVYTQTDSNGFQIHDPVIISSPNHIFLDELKKVCITHTGKEGKGRRAALKLAKKIILSNHDNSLASNAKRLFLDNSFLSQSVPLLVQGWIPEPIDFNKFQFCTEETGNGVTVTTNLNFDVLNSLYHKRVPISHSSLSPAYILSNIYDIESDLYFASRNLSELATSPLSSELLALRLSHLTMRCSKSQNQKDSFQDFIFSEQKKIREEFNLGHIPLEKLLEAIYNADKFKDWLISKDIDASLLKEYFNEVTKDTLIEKLLGKTVRWSIFTGTGILSDLFITGGIGTTTGIALSVLDNFFLEKLIAGWKPNNFVEEYLLGLHKNELHMIGQ